MVSAKDKANGATSDSSSKADDATETTLSNSIILSVEETLVVSGSTDVVEDIKGVNDEGKTLITVNNEECKEEEEEEEANEESENEDVADDEGEKVEEADDESEKEEVADDESEKEKEHEDESQNEKENVVAEDEANEENASEEGEGEEEDKENERNVGEEQNDEEVEAKPKEGGRKPRRRNRKKKVELKGSEIVTTDGVKPEPSNKKKASKKVEGMGMIFMCSSKTKTDCFRYKILGLPAGKKDQVQKIYKGMRLFLFDIDLKLMYGIFKAAAPGGYNIEPKAFKSAFPSQVRFTVMEDCLPLAEEKIKEDLKEIYYARNKFNCQLTSEQVKKLCNLFTIAGKGSTSKAAGGRNRKAETHASVDQGRRKRRAREEERGPAHASVDQVKHKRRAREEERGPAHTSVDQVRRKRWVREEEQRPVYRREHRHRERLVPYKRDVYESSRAPARRLEQLPPLAPAPVYVYERPLERHPYLRDPVMEHRGVRFIDPEPRDRDEVRAHEPYLVYRDAPSYRDTAYATGLPLEYAPPATLPLEYRHVSREYHSDAGQSAAYHLSGGLQAGYRAVVEPTAGYYPPSSSVLDYQSRRTNYRY